jgi:hypothetical protein
MKRHWQFKLATWLRVYNYVKNMHVRAETIAYLACRLCIQITIYRGIDAPYGTHTAARRAESYIGDIVYTVTVDKTRKYSVCLNSRIAQRLIGLVSGQECACFHDKGLLKGRRL